MFRFSYSFAPLSYTGVVVFFFYHGRNRESTNKPVENIMGAMSEAITFETMPKAMEYLIGKIDALEKVLLKRNEVPAIPAITWFNIDELKDRVLNLTYPIFVSFIYPAWFVYVSNYRLKPCFFYFLLVILTHKNR